MMKESVQCKNEEGPLNKMGVPFLLGKWVREFFHFIKFGV